MHFDLSARLLFVAASVALLSASPLAAVEGIPLPSTATIERPRLRAEPPFPAAYFSEGITKAADDERSRPYWAESELEAFAAARVVSDYRSLLLNDDIVAFYGSPKSKRMGILGAYPIHELDALLGEWANAYDAANGDRGVRKAFYVIYGTVWPEGEIGILNEAKLVEYIEYALERDILVFVDHQIGKYTVAEAMRRLLPFLRYPNVHLALDPEWRTTKPMLEIGTVTAEELNEAQRTMEDFIVEHGYPGERMLVVHQFNHKMIAGRESVLSDFARVRLVHCADGFGPPAMKRYAYEYNSRASNMPVKGFKLFFKSGVPGAGFDDPLMSPDEVLGLQPRPYLVMYQ